MSEEDFKKLFQKFVETEQLSREVAEQLLQKILNILFPNKGDDDG